MYQLLENADTDTDTDVRGGFSSPKLVPTIVSRYLSRLEAEQLEKDKIRNNKKRQPNPTDELELSNHPSLVSGIEKLVDSFLEIFLSLFATSLNVEIEKKPQTRKHVARPTPNTAIRPLDEEANKRNPTGIPTLRPTPILTPRPPQKGLQITQCNIVAPVVIQPVGPSPHIAPYPISPIR